MNIFKRKARVTVESKIDGAPDMAKFPRPTQHVFALHNDAIFDIEENENGVMIGGRQFTREQAIAQLESVADGLRFIANQLKQE
jgi:hypothetical protein